MITLNKQTVIVKDYKDMKVEKLRKNTRSTLVTRYMVVIRFGITHTFHRKGMNFYDAQNLRNKVITEQKADIKIEPTEDGYYRVVLNVCYYGFHTEKLNLQTAQKIKDGLE
jgi:hypothetical protein